MAKKPIKSKYTEDFVPVKSITNGVIILDNNEKVCGIKIMPRNIFILDYDTQNAIIANLRNVYNMIDYEFWIIVADRPVDINVYLSQLQLLYNSTQDQAIRNLITNFASAGLNSTQVTNDDLRIILDNFLNGGQTTNFGTVMPGEY